MAETHDDQVNGEQVVLDVGQDVGALVLYTGEELCGRDIEVSLKGNDAQRVHTAILEWRVNGCAVFAGVYPALPAGDYHTWGNGAQPTGDVTIVGGEVAQVDWR